MITEPFIKNLLHNHFINTKKLKKKSGEAKDKRQSNFCLFFCFIRELNPHPPPYLLPLPTYQWKSPFDTCPCTTSPVSLTNLQVSVGGQNVLQSTLQYGYEHFLEQVNLAEQLTSSDFGISTGLINQNYWENSKWYYVNVERGNAADKLNGRNINVSFTNNSNVPIEVMVFIFYSDEIVIDVKTGLVSRHKN